MALVALCVTWMFFASCAMAALVACTAMRAAAMNRAEATLVARPVIRAVPAMRADTELVARSVIRPAATIFAETALVARLMKRPASVIRAETVLVARSVTRPTAANCAEMALDARAVNCAIPAMRAVTIGDALNVPATRSLVDPIADDVAPITEATKAMLRELVVTTAANVCLTMFAAVVKRAIAEIALAVLTNAARTTLADASDVAAIDARAPRTRRAEMADVAAWASEKMTDATRALTVELAVRAARTSADTFAVVVEVDDS
jgi:hypothetical protein